MRGLSRRSHLHKAATLDGVKDSIIQGGSGRPQFYSSLASVILNGVRPYLSIT